ncbi:hypothetical protein HOM50_03900 [bacterium]|jgi:hypothetical protein|nr:hypothetical protein [bacterium]MBT5015522.1 hypothetical protein [bacterium]
MNKKFLLSALCVTLLSSNISIHAGGIEEGAEKVVNAAGEVVESALESNAAEKSASMFAKLLGLVTGGFSLAAKPFVAVGKPVVNAGRTYAIDPLNKYVGSPAFNGVKTVGTKVKPVATNPWVIGVVGASALAYVAYKVYENGYEESMRNLGDTTSKVASHKKTLAAGIASALAGGAYWYTR